MAPPAFGLSRADTEVIISLACSLDERPGSNWVQKAGGLPSYICEVAKAIKKTGKDTSTAIAMAVSRVKRWAATGEGDTKAKAAKALAEWESLKAKSRSKSASTVKAANSAADVTRSSEEPPLVMLSKATTSTPDYSLDSIRSAWDSLRSAARRARRKENPTTWSDVDSPVEYAYVREVWNRWIIVRAGDSEEKYFRIPYSVAADGEVSFGTPTEVVQSYVDVVTPDDTDHQLSDVDLTRLMALSGPCVAESFVDLGPLPTSHAMSLVELARTVSAQSGNASRVTKAHKWY